MLILLNVINYDFFTNSFLCILSVYMDVNIITLYDIMLFLRTDIIRIDYQNFYVCLFLYCF